ncbi:DUF927 domain-containing protein [Clostridium sp. Mt-5]|uniref:DUF927 domain-containing protein n=1 Tax=Clostridium moutaii TaxID=3240932 RepID=A0ABV4BT04_9CLOT
MDKKNKILSENKLKNENHDNSIVKLVNVNKNIDTDEYSAILEFDFKGYKNNLEVIRSSYLTKKEIIKMQDYGMDVTEANASEIIRNLQLQEKEAPITLVHSALGFGIFDNKIIFKHFSGINISSHYNEDLDIEPKGKYDVWYKMVSDYVVGNVYLETILTIGFSSAIVGLMGFTSSFDSILVHLCGDSTAGKTTAAMLAISIWGNPSTKINNGLSNTWNSTENAMFNNVIGNHGLAVLFDEVSMIDVNDFTKFIYKIVGNRDKKRLDKDLNIDDTGTWASTFISTGEFSLLEKSKKNTGAKLRIINFDNVSWTMNAESAEIIQKTILKNYGHAGIKFVESLIDKVDISKLNEELKKVRNKIIMEMENKKIIDKYSNRRSWKYAVLVYTASKVNEFLNISIDVEKVCDFLLENESQSIEGREMDKVAFDYFLEQVNINYKKFLKSDLLYDDSKNTSYEIMGKINILDNEKYNEICIPVNLFKKIMKDGGFEDHKIVLKKWKKSGILDCESDRYTRKRKLFKNGGYISVYVIKINKDECTGNIE